MKSILIIFVALVILVGCTQQQASFQSKAQNPGTGAAVASQQNTDQQTVSAKDQATEAAVTGQQNADSTGQQNANSQKSVIIKNFAFSPVTLTIQKGATVTWTQEDSVGHTVTAYDGSFNSPVLSKGDSWSFAFSTAGTYKYHCSPHPNMQGEIIVV